MRLLNTKTFEFVSINDPHSVSYAVLSHVWSKQGEQTYQEILELVAEANRESNPRRASNIRTRISGKVRRCCARGLADGYEFVWIDSCCIVKTSSAELSEAINSVYTWYSCAALQELVFLSQKWNHIGTKSSLAPLIETITSVEVDILTGVRSPREVSVSKRMSWAARRVTTPKEDRAYSLLGLFGIHMLTIHGEVMNAFFRLQEDILKQIPDDTLFTRGRRFLMRKESHLQCLKQQLLPWRDAYNSLFASSPSDFTHTSDLRPISHTTLLQRLCLSDDKAQHVPPTYTTTRFGIRAEIPLLCFEDSQAGMYSGARAKIGFLLCKDACERLIAVILRDDSRDFPRLHDSTYRDFTRLHDTMSSALLVGARIPVKPDVYKTQWSDHRLVAFTGDALEHIRQSGHISVTLVHISKGVVHAQEDTPVRLDGNSNRACSLVFPPWRKSALAKAGFVVQETFVNSEMPHRERKHVFVLSHDVHGVVRIVVDLDTTSPSLCLQMGKFAPGMPLTTDILTGEAVACVNEVFLVEPLLRAKDSNSTNSVLYPVTSGTHASGTAETVLFLRPSVTSSHSPRDVVFTLDLEIVHNLPQPLYD